MTNKKDCFGMHESSNVSWHCKGCIVAEECKEFYEVIRMKNTNEEKTSLQIISKNKLNVKDVRQALEIMGDIFEVKNEKYGNSFEKSLDKYGIIAALTRISDKFNRIETLILNNDEGTNDETVQDTLIDLANYCVMTAVYLKNSGE